MRLKFEKHKPNENFKHENALPSKRDKVEKEFLLLGWGRNRNEISAVENADVRFTSSTVL